MLQMAYARGIPHIAHLIAQVFQITEHEVERDGRTGMVQMRVTRTQKD